MANYDTGIAMLQAIIAGDMPQPAMGHTMNFRLVEIAEGRAVFQGHPTEAHMNPLGTVHGGWCGTILDSALGCAVQSALPPGTVYTTLEYKVNLTRALQPGDNVTCIGTVQHAGRRTSVAQAEVRLTESGKLVATGSTTCVVLPAKAG